MKDKSFKYGFVPWLQEMQPFVLHTKSAQFPLTMKGMVINMKKLIIVLALLMIFTAGCGENNTESGSEDFTNGDVSRAESNNAADVGYEFKHNGITIKLNAEAAPVIEALGEPVEYFESPSCAFQGLDKFYYYNGFEINTYEINTVDYISAIKLMDDSISTAEGVSIGSELAEVLTAYGDGYEKEQNFYTYTLGSTHLQFIAENNIITDIYYIAIVKQS